MTLVHVEFDWSDECGPCDDCGLPAAYMAQPGAAMLCSRCAALAIAYGDADRLTHLFAEPVTDTAAVGGQWKPVND